MKLIDRVREFAAETQSIYLETMLAIQAAQKAKIKARQDLLDRGFRAKYSLDAWRRVDVEKIHENFRALLTDRINSLLKNKGAGIEIGSDELPSFEAPEYRKHASLDLEDFALIEVDAALKADFVADVESIADKFAPEAVAERARREAIEGLQSALGLKERWTVVREAKDAMVFEISNRNDPSPDASLCFYTEGRLYGIGKALDALIKTEGEVQESAPIDLDRLQRTTHALRCSKAAGRIRVDLSADATIAVFKSKIELTVSLPLFALISAATAPADMTKAA